MSKTITPELRSALARLCDDHRRFRHVPGYNDGPMELGDWTLIHCAIDPDMQPTRQGIPDPPGTIPAAAVPSPEVIAAISHILTFADDRDVDGQTARQVSPARRGRSPQGRKPQERRSQ